MLHLAHISSARTAINRAYSIQLGSPDLEQTTSRSTKNNSASLIASGIEAGKVIAVVEALPKQLRHWAVWAYGPEAESFSLSAQAGFFKWLVERVDQALANSERQYREATAAKIRDVIAHAVLNHRSRSSNGRDLTPLKEIKRQCGIRPDKWLRDFAPWYSWMLDLCSWLDRKTLPPVGKLLALVREEESLDQSAVKPAKPKESLRYLRNLRA